MSRYSVAIRTLGTNPEMLRRELESVYAQTVQPRRVVIYIAKGYKVPDFRVRDEIYVEVRKGMVAQRALQYREIDTELLLLLDDDVYLPPQSVEMLIDALDAGGYDCVSPDTFANHKMNLKGRLYSFCTNLSLPLRNSRYAFRIHGNGTLSYLSNPGEGVYESQSAAGPCALWRKDVYVALDLESEMWMDKLKFAYADDQLIHYKLWANGGRLAMHYGTGILHCDGRSARGGAYRKTDIFITRAEAQYIVWHRSLYACEPSRLRRALRALSLCVKLVWLLPVHIVAAIGYRDIRVPYYYLLGTARGIAYTRSAAYKSLRPYIGCDIHSPKSKISET